jgi:hypothetical protein
MAHERRAASMKPREQTGCGNRGADVRPMDPFTTMIGAVARKQSRPQLLPLRRSGWRGNLSGIRRANDGFHADCSRGFTLDDGCGRGLTSSGARWRRWRTNRRNTSSQTRIDAAFRLLPLRRGKGVIGTRITSKLNSLSYDLSAAGGAMADRSG